MLRTWRRNAQARQLNNRNLTIDIRISDWHCLPFIRRLGRVVDVVARWRPKLSAVVHQRPERHVRRRWGSRCWGKRFKLFFFLRAFSQLECLLYSLFPYHTRLIQIKFGLCTFSPRDVTTLRLSRGEGVPSSFHAAGLVKCTRRWAAAFFFSPNSLAPPPYLFSLSLSFTQYRYIKTIIYTLS